MTPFSRLTLEFRQTFWLALPLIAASAGNHVMGLVDMAVVGRLGEIPMAAASLGNALYFGSGMLGMGLLFGLDPLVSQAVGENNRQRAYNIFQQALRLAWGLSLPLGLLCFALFGVLSLLKVDAGTQHETMLYLLARVPGLLPFYVYITYRGYLQALEKTRGILFATILANLLNIPLSIFLAHGGPTLAYIGITGVTWQGWGVMGAGLASTLVTFVQMWFLWRSLPADDNLEKPPYTLAGLLPVLRVGWPIAVQLLAGGGVFVTVTLIMGVFGPTVVSGHQIALQCATLTFSICVGISSAASVRVGHAVGQRDHHKARRAGVVALFMGVTMMMGSAWLFWTKAAWLSSLFTDKTHIINASLPFFQMAALFQIVDGLQHISLGSLRGAGQTRIPMITNLVSHWLIAVPFGLWVTFGLKWGPRGLWMGLVLGLTLVGIVLTTTFFRMSSKPIEVLK